MSHPQYPSTLKQYMNFLAHLYLSGNHSELLVGNFIADFLRGKTQRLTLTPQMQQGVALHHAIDTFMDQHPIVKKGVIRLRPTYRKYSPVIIDVFYDHFLAINWEQFHTTPLPIFAKDTYQILKEHYQYLPPKVQQLLPYMIRQDWLSNYAGFYGIGKALEGLSRRASFQNRMNEAIDDLKLYYEEFNQEFQAFFPEMIAHVQPFWEEASKGKS